jgi:hypothetical protein
MSALEHLAKRLLDTKLEENEVKARRIELEEQIAELVETPERGSRTVEAGEGVKVTVKRGLLYKVDVSGLRASGLADEFGVLKSVPATFKLDEAAYERVTSESQNAATRLSEYVTVTPAKVSVTVKMGE